MIKLVSLVDFGTIIANSYVKWNNSQNNDASEKIVHHIRENIVNILIY